MNEEELAMEVAHLRACKKKSNDERWTDLEREVFWIKKTLEQHNIALSELADNIKE